MAKTSMINRDKNRTALVAKYAVRRAELRDKVKNIKLSEEERHAAMVALQKLPRDSSYTRRRNRCSRACHEGRRRREIRPVVLREARPDGRHPVDLGAAGGA